MNRHKREKIEVKEREKTDGRTSVHIEERTDKNSNNTKINRNETKIIIREMFTIDIRCAMKWCFEFLYLCVRQIKEILNFHAYNGNKNVKTNEK